MKHKFSRLTALLVALMVMISMMSSVAYAAEAPVEVELGKKVTVDFPYANIYGLDGTFTFDGDIISNVEYKESGGLSGLMQNEKVMLSTGAETAASGKVSLVLTLKDDVQVGDVCTITFTYRTADKKGDLTPQEPIIKIVKVIEASEPGTEPTVPDTEPTEPSVGPTEPSVGPTEPSVGPTEPSVEPTEPSVEPTEPSVGPTEPGTEPTLPGAEPVKPGSDSSVWIIVLLIGLVAIAGVAGAYIYIIKKKNRQDNTPLIDYNIDDDDDDVEDDYADEDEATNSVETEGEESPAGENTEAESAEPAETENTEVETVEVESNEVENTEAEDDKEN